MSAGSIGWLPGVARFLSPNRDERPPGTAVELLVIHAISLPPGEFGGPHVVELFQNRLDPAAHEYFTTIAHLRVSAHFLIDRAGAVIQFVPCDMRAWHAGASQWRGRSGCNDFSIGIELEGCDDQGFSDDQYAALAILVEQLRARYPLIAAAGHSDIAPGRKTDPGPHFDWSRLPLVRA